jgi:hypothetical protein
VALKAKNRSSLEEVPVIAYSKVLFYGSLTEGIERERETWGEESRGLHELPSFRPCNSDEILL